MVLPRLRSQPGVLVAVLASVLVATTLLAAGPVLATAVAEGGLRADLEQAAPSRIGIEVEVQTRASRVTDVVSTVEVLLEERFGEDVAPPDVFVQGGTVHLAGQPDDVVTPVAVQERFTSDVFDDRQLLAEVEVAARPFEVQPVQVHADALPALGARVGDVLVTDDGARLQVAAAVAPRDPTDRRWWDDPVGRDGVVPGVGFTEVGPVYVSTPQDLEPILGPDPRVAVRLRALPVLERVTPASLQALGTAATSLRDRLDLVLAAEDLAAAWTIDVPLASAAEAATVSLAAARAAVLATVGQVAVLAVYTLGLAGRLLRSGREVETMLLRARGATPEQLGVAAAREGLVLVVPAVLAAPWLAAGLVRLLSVLGVTRGAAVDLTPEPSVAALVAAVVAGAACLVVLVVPAITSARRTYAAARTGRGRRSPISAVQALGLDLALAAIAAIGIWQLRSSGGLLGVDAPRGPGDVDPVLVAAPALGLLAGALLVLRLVPSLARAGEVLAGRVRGLVAGLGGWQVARRPDAVSRPTLLLVLAVAVGVLAGTYGATWRTSQTDQADAAVGADLVVEPDQRVDALPTIDLPTALTALPPVDRTRPTWSAPVALAPGAPRGTVVGIDATDPLLAARDDQRPTVPYADLDVAPLAGLELASGARLEVDATLAPDPRWPELGAELSLVVRDGVGLVHRLDDRPVTAGATATLSWSVAEAVPPLALVALDVTTQAGDANGAGYVGPPPAPPPPPPQPPGPAAFPEPPVLDLRVSSPRVDGEPTPPTGAWPTDPYDDPAAVVPPEHVATEVGTDGWHLQARTGVAGPLGRTATLRVVHPDAAAASDGDPVPAVVGAEVLAATGREVGDDLGVAVRGAPLTLSVVGTVPLVPGEVDTPLPVVVDLDAVTAARWRSERAVTRPTRWLLALDEQQGDVTERLAVADALAVELAAPPVRAAGVRSAAADEAARRADPIALGLLAALVLGAGAAGVLAVLGTLTTAVAGVRERAADFALLQAVGTSLRQVRWWLAGEVALVVVVGLVAGGLLGAVLVWAVLPTIALAADGSAAVPPPEVVVPVAGLAVVTAVVVALFALVPVVLSRVVARAHVAEVLRLGEDT